MTFFSIRKLLPSHFDPQYALLPLPIILFDRYQRHQYVYGVSILSKGCQFGHSLKKEAWSCCNRTNPMDLLEVHEPRLYHLKDY